MDRYLRQARRTAQPAILLWIVVLALALPALSGVSQADKNPNMLGIWMGGIQGDDSQQHPLQMVVTGQDRHRFAGGLKIGDDPEMLAVGYFRSHHRILIRCYQDNEHLKKVLLKLHGVIDPNGNQLTNLISSSTGEPVGPPFAMSRR